MSNHARLVLLSLVCCTAAAGCHHGASVALLCHSCASDSDCNGNPCYTDKTGGHFCGAPCGSCPNGFSCQPVEGSTGAVVQTCFPTDEVCVAPGGDSGVSADGGPTIEDLAGADLAIPNCDTPSSAGVTTAGGTVDRLFFAYTGDTRAANDESGYDSSLQMVINNIMTQAGQKGVQFLLDGGDHMEASSASEAAANMTSYQTAAALLGKPVFMTYGNHECDTSFDAEDCGYAGAQTSDFKFAAYMTSLQKVSNQTSPYYRFDVMTSTGKATFIVVADDAWGTTEQTWLTTQLTDTDANSTYTFISKHHPEGNTDEPDFPTIYSLVTAHKYTLLLTSHSHEYKRQPDDPRAVVMGLGGAPFDNPDQMWWGYLTVMQCPDNHFYVTAYDQSTGNVMESFNVPAQ